MCRRRGLRDWSLFMRWGTTKRKTVGGGASEVESIKNCGGGAKKVSAILSEGRGGTEDFGVVLTQEHEFLVTVKGGAKSIHPLKWVCEIFTLS